MGSFQHYQYSRLPVNLLWVCPSSNYMYIFDWISVESILEIIFEKYHSTFYSNEEEKKPMCIRFHIKIVRNSTFLLSRHHKQEKIPVMDLVKRQKQTCKQRQDIIFSPVHDRRKNSFYTCTDPLINVLSWYLRIYNWHQQAFHTSFWQIIAKEAHHNYYARLARAIARPWDFPTPFSAPLPLGSKRSPLSPAPPPLSLSFHSVTRVILLCDLKFPGWFHFIWANFHNRIKPARLVLRNLTDLYITSSLRRSRIQWVNNDYYCYLKFTFGELVFVNGIFFLDCSSYCIDC